MNRKTMALAWAGTTAAALMLGYGLAYQPVKPTPTPRATTTRAESIPLTEVRAQTVSENFQSAGNLTIDPDRESHVGSPLNGRITSVQATVGDRVTQGSPLAVLTSPEITRTLAEYHHAELRLEQARRSLAGTQQLIRLGDETRRPIEEAREKIVETRADLAVRRSDRDFAARNLQRVESLFKLGVVTKREVEKARAELYQAKTREQQAEQLLQLSQHHMGREQTLSSSGARTGPKLIESETELALAQEQVRHLGSIVKNLGFDPGSESGGLVLRAPRAGRVTERNVSLGEAVKAEEDLFRIVDTSTLWLWIHLREAELGQAPVGALATLHTAADPKATFQGRVSYVAPLLDATTRTVQARILVDNRQGRLKPGMFVQATFKDEAPQTLLTLPASSVTVEGTQHVVFRPTGKGFQRVEVEVGRQGGDWVQIKKGLQKGDRVVAEARRLLQEGQL